MSFIRARQRTITALSPHQANPRFLIPKRFRALPDPALVPVALWDETSIVGDPVTSTVDNIGGLTAFEVGVPNGIVQTTVNGLAAMQSAISDTVLRSAVPNLLPTPYSMVTVGQFDGQENAADSAGHLMDGRTTNANRCILRRRDTQGDYVNRPSGESGGSNSAYPLGNMAVFQCDVLAGAGAGYTSYINNAITDDAGTHSDQSFDLITFFGDSSASRREFGIVCEVRLYNQVLSDAERFQLTGFLRAKWGI